MTIFEYIQMTVILIYIVATYLVGVYVLPKQYRQSLIADKLIPFRKSILVVGAGFFALSLISAAILSVRFITVATQLEEYVRAAVIVLLVAHAVSLIITALAMHRVYTIRIKDES